MHVKGSSVGRKHTDDTSERDENQGEDDGGDEETRGHADRVELAEQAQLRLKAGGGYDAFQVIRTIDLKLEFGKRN